MIDSQFDIEVRVLLCRHCGAPVTVPVTGGQVKCGYCQSYLHTVRRPPASDGALPGQAVFPSEQERLNFLAVTARTYDDKNPYSTCDPPADLEYVNLENSDPGLPSLLTKALSEAITVCESSGGAQAHQRRVFWLVHKTANMWNWRNEGWRARAAIETGSEVLTDPGYRQKMYCLMASIATQAGELEAGEQWLALCDPAPTILDLDTAQRVTRTGFAIERSLWEQALVLVGRSYEAMPPACPNSIPQMTLDRVACLEGLGEHGAADREMTRALEEHLDPRLPILDHDFLAQWLNGSKRLRLAAAVWERLERRQNDQMAMLTKVEATRLLSERTALAYAESERRLAAAKRKTRGWPMLGLSSILSKLDAAKQLAPAISAYIGGRGGLSASDDERYHVVGWAGERLLSVCILWAL